MTKFLTLDDIDPSGKTVLLRADLNVPVQDGKVTDATRIERLAPTILELLEKGARVVVMYISGGPRGASLRSRWRRSCRRCRSHCTGAPSCSPATASGPRRRRW